MTDVMDCGLVYVTLKCGLELCGTWQKINVDPNAVKQEHEFGGSCELEKEERKGEEGCEKLVLLPSYGYGSIVCWITLGFVILIGFKLFKISFWKLFWVFMCVLTFVVV